MLDSSTLHHHYIHTKLRHSTSNKLLGQEALEVAEVDRETVDTHTEDTVVEEDGASSQEEVEEGTPLTDLAVLDSPVPLAARADQEAQEELEEGMVAAEADQATLRALELRQNGDGLEDLLATRGWGGYIFLFFTK